MVITIPGATKHIDYTQLFLDERQKLVYNNLATCGINPLCMVAAKLVHRMQAMGSWRSLWLFALVIISLYVILTQNIAFVKRFFSKKLYKKQKI